MLDGLDKQHGLEILSHSTAATRARAFLNEAYARMMQGKVRFRAVLVMRQ